MRSSREGMNNRILRVHNAVVSSQELLSTAQVCRKSGLCLFPNKCSHNQAREILKGLVDTEEIDEHGTGRSWKLYSKKGLLPDSCKIVRFCKAKSLREIIVEHGQEFKEARLEVQTYEKSNRRSHSRIVEFIKKVRSKINARIDRLREAVKRDFRQVRAEFDVRDNESSKQRIRLTSLENEIRDMKKEIKELKQSQDSMKKGWGFFKSA